MSQTNIGVPFPNTYWVVPGKFLAGEHPREINDAATRARLAALVEAGIRTFLDLTEKREHMQSYSEPLGSIAAAHQIEVELHNASIPDRGVPSVEILSSLLDLIDRSIANHNPVYVHCFAGIGRTGTIVGCYLMRHGLAKAPEVITRISDLRSQMPGGRETSPHTSEQVAMVMNWKPGT